MTQVVLLPATTSFTLPPDWHANYQAESGVEDLLNDVRLKIKRADLHIKEIDAAIRNFEDSHVIVRETDSNRNLEDSILRLYERDADGIHEVIKLKVAPIPEMLPVIIGEAISQLRSSLDLLACCLAKANGVTDTKSIYFPVAKDVNIFKDADTQKKIKNLSAEAQRFIRRLKPYKGGCDLLWALNELRNKDIHVRLLALAPKKPTWKGTIPVARPANDANRGIVIIEYPQTFEKEIVLARCIHGANVNPDTKPEISIAFGDIEFFKGEPVLTVLPQLFNLVQRIVDIAERLFFRAN